MSSLSSGSNVNSNVYDHFGGYTGEGIIRVFITEYGVTPVAPKNEIRPLSSKDQVEGLRAIGFNMSEIGSVLFVTRQTVYEWLLESGKNPLREKNQKRLNQIYQILKEDSIKELNLRKYLRQIFCNGKSLFDLLTEPNLNKELIFKALQRIQKKREQDKIEQEKHEQFLSKHGLVEENKEQIRLAIKMHRSIG